MAKSSERTETCAVCEVGVALERVRQKEIQPLGRKVTYTLREWHCPSCDSAYFDDAQLAANQPAELVAKAKALGTVGPEDLRWVREQAGTTQAELEVLLGLGKNTLARWETGARPLPPYIATVVRLVGLRPTLLRDLAEVLRVGRSPKPTRKAARLRGQGGKGSSRLEARPRAQPAGKGAGAVRARRSA